MLQANRKILRLLPFLAFLLGSCRSPQEDHRVLSDLIADFDIAIKEVLPSDVEIQAGVRDRNLLSGWYPVTPNNALLAAGPESEIRFFSRQDTSLWLKLKCRPVRPVEDRGQVISIFINSTGVSSVALDPGWSDHQVELPSRLLKPGENLLRFEYKETVRPRDKRVLSVAFSDISWVDKRKRIRPHPGSIQKIEGKIIQPPDSILIYYSQISGSSQLRLHLDDIREQTEVLLSVESGERQRLDVLLNQPGPVLVDLEGFSDQIVKLTFQARWISGDETSTAKPIVWSEMKIVDWGQNQGAGSADEDREKLPRSHHDVLYIVLDAFHAKHASLYGYHRETTPFLEKLGKESVVFENFFAHSPYTLASTGTLLSSRYPHRHGLTRIQSALDRSLALLPKILSEADADSYLISDHRFLTSDEWGLNRDYAKILIKGSYRNSRKEIGEALQEIYDGEKGKNRKFVYLHLIPPHWPYDPPPEFRIFHDPEAGIDLTEDFLERIENETYTPSQKELDYIESMYDANVLYADAIVEGIYEFLEDRALLDRSILMVTSDHGEASRMEHGRLGHNSTLYDEMIHIPFILRLPEDLEPRTIEAISGIVDVAPTILELFGVEPVPGFEGHSFLPLIAGRGDAGSKDYVFLENPGRNQLGIRGPQFKYIASSEKRELFDIKADPEEKKSLYPQKPIVSGYYEQLIAKEYDPRQILTGSESVNLDELSEEQKRKLRELGYVR